MIKILNKCGYYVGDVEGKQNVIANVLDGCFFTIYFILSLWNLFSGTPSTIAIALNLISIARMITKNYIEQSKIVAKSNVTTDYISAGITKIHPIKIAVEGTSMFFALVLLIISLVQGNLDIGTKILVLINLLFTEFENLISVIERLYDAKPRMLLIDIEDNK